MKWLEKFFRPKKVSFKVRAVSGIELSIMVEGTQKQVTQIETGDFMVFRTKEFLSPAMTKSFIDSLSTMTTKKVLLLPNFIEVVHFERK